MLSEYASGISPVPNPTSFSSGSAAALPSDPAAEEASSDVSVSEPVSIPAVSSVFPVSSATVVSVFLLLPSESFFKEKLHPMRLPASAILNTINPAFFSSFLPSFLYLITASLYFQHFLLPAVWF